MKSNSWGRLWGALGKPGETFESIAERPTWALALAVLSVVSAAAVLAMFSRVDMAEAIRQQVVAQGREVSPAMMQQMGRVSGCITAVSVLGTPLFYLAMAAVFLLFNLLGGQLDYRKSLAVTVHAALPRAVQALLTIPVALARSGLTLEEMRGGLLRSNLAFLAPEGAGKPLVALLSSFDLFTLWNLVLLVIGYRVAARVSRATAATTVVVLWAVVVAVLVALSALGGARGGPG